jgi:hypothetical protein
MPGRIFACSLLAGTAILAASPAGAECRLALALAFDVSRSVSAQDYAIQRGGILAALADPAVRAAFLDPADHVALAIYEWSAEDHQRMVTGWTEIPDAADLDRVMGAMRAHVRDARGAPTAIGSALEYGLALMRRAPVCAEQVLDISGDGRNNQGIDPAAAYARQDFGALRVNGLAIRTYEFDVADYYRENVIRGPGAFVEVADGQDDFPRAILRKLMRELTEQVIGQAGRSLPAKG